MKYKIVVDSSCDLTRNYMQDDEIGFSVVPLTIHVGPKEFVDDEHLDVDEMLKEINEYPGKTTTSCPSPGEYMAEFADAEYVFCVTISSKMSGSYNSAKAASEQMSSDNIFVIDSKGASGTLNLIVDELVRLIRKGHEFAEIKDKINEYVANSHLFFVLNRFDNLVKNGRMSKIVSFVAMALFIKPLCEAVDGEIKIIEKPRTLRATYKRIVANIKERVSDLTDRTCIISYCQDLQAAQEVETMVKADYDFKEVRVQPMRGLCSFYALNKGIIVTF